MVKNIDNFNLPISRVHSFVFSKNIGTPYTGKTIYTNGGGKVQNSTTNQAIPIESYNGSSIGNAINSKFYHGIIAEIIIYSRALSDEERRDIENYLSQKWGIKLNR